MQLSGVRPSVCPFIHPASAAGLLLPEDIDHLLHGMARSRKCGECHVVS